MITVSLLGGDQYLAPEIVSGIQTKLADLYETDPEEIVFYAPDSFLIFNGVEQTSYQLNVVVEAPRRLAVTEKSVAQYLLKSLQDYAVHIHVLFRYFDPEHEYAFVNPDYPRFMTASNSLKFDADDEPAETESDMEEPYLGNAFKSVEDKFGSSTEVCFDECDCEDDPKSDGCSSDCHYHKH